MSLLVLLAMTCTALLTGGLVLRRVAPEAGWPVRACAGFVVLHLLWQGLDAAGIAWSPPTLFFLLGSLFVAGGWWAMTDLSRREGRLPLLSRSHWIDLLSLAVPSAVYGWAALTMRAPYADFVYHWGAKARRFALVQGIDWDSLARSELFHSDYPLLVSELFAVNRLLAGIESEGNIRQWVNPHWPTPGSAPRVPAPL